MRGKITVRSAFLSLAVSMLVAAGTYFSGTAGCGSSSEGTPTPPPTGSTSTTSGGLATIGTSEGTFGFVPNGTSISVITLEGAEPGSLQVGLKADTVPISTTFTVDSCAADGTNFKVVCVGFDSSKVAIVDVAGLISSGDVPSVDEFDIGNTEVRSSSGGSCLNCGVLCDAANDRFIVSSGDGYRVFNYDGDTQASYLSDTSASPPMDLFTENFGFANGFIVSPEYTTTNLFLWIIDINNDKIYRWVHALRGNTSDPTGLQSLQDAGILDMVADAAAVDPSTNILTIGDEFTNSFLVLDLGEATFDDGAGTFDAPEHVLKMENVAGSGLLATGQAFESVSHFLFLEDEFGSSMGLVEDASDPDTDYTSANLPDPSATCTTAFGWSNVGDPHGLALFTGFSDGKPKGLLINSDKSCAAVVDLTAFRDAAKASGTHQVDASVDLLAEGIVTYIPIP